MATKVTPGTTATVAPIRAAGPLHQTVIFTALPNGVAGGKVKLSVFVSPRLESTGATDSTRLPLSSFPDWVNWPEQAATLTFDVLFDEHQAAGVTRVAPPGDPSDPTAAEIWGAIFSGTTPVKPYAYTPPLGREVRHYPVQNIHNRLREVYQTVAWESPHTIPSLVGDQTVVGLHNFLAEIALNPAQQTAATEQINAQYRGSAARTFRVAPYAPSSVAPKLMQGVQTHAPAPAIRTGVAKVPALKLGVVGGTVLAPAAIDFHMTKMFYDRPEMAAMVARPLPWNQTADFHQIVSALGQFPTLLRRVGLVIDLEIPVSGLTRASNVWVVPHWTPKSATGSGGPDNPKTAIIFDPGASRFVAQSKPPDADNPGGSDMANGMLKLNDPNRFEVGQMDLDGTALKTLSIAEQYVAGMPAATAIHAAGLPTLAPGAVKPRAVKPGAVQPAAVKPEAALISPGLRSNVNLAAAAGPILAQMTQASLSAMRSAGIWVAHNDRAAKLVASAVDAAARNDAVKSGKTNEQILYAEDLARGLRVDVWDETSKKWYALCRRVGTYTLTKSSKALQPIEDEGWVSTGATHADTPDAPLYLHECMFRFEGWGFSVPRPGTASTPPGVPQDNSFPYGIDIAFAAKTASFPRLRFGREYRLRARVVDLAGNSLDPSITDDSMATAPVTYFRHEPIVPPTLVPRKDLKSAATPGESVEHMVIHSLNSSPAQDHVPTGDTTERNAAAPKVSENMAETHGMFDKSGDGLDPDAYSVIIAHDGDFPVEGYVDRPSLTLPYLPDPLAAFCALRFHYTHDIHNIADQMGNMPFTPGSPTNKWPDIQSFRIIAFEPSSSTTQIQVDTTARTVKVPLPKAATGELVLSCGLAEVDLPKTGIWRYTVEKPFNPVLATSRLPVAQTMQINRDLHKPTMLAAHASAVGLQQADISKLGQLKQQATQGMNWLISPTRTITLVHAVQQPLLTPDISKIGAYRNVGQTYARLYDEFPISGKSTAKVAVTARWDEYFDYLTEPKWRTKAARASVFEVPVKPEAETVRFQFPADSANGTAAMSSRPPEPESTLTRHEFGDTLRRQIYYTCTATTRFREFFTQALANDPNFKITRESPEQLLDIPSSARPMAPKLLYVLPTFAWNRDPSKLTSYRAGGLRVYMHRPWFSSGVGERLGVILCDEGKGGPPLGTDDKLLPFLTQWGQDPIWKQSSRLADYPRLEHFQNTADDGKASGLILDEIQDRTVSVAGYEVFYDDKRQLWYADIDMNVGDAYMPFVRLVLARFQPNSVKDPQGDMHLSRCVIADFAQIVPGRFASVSKADGGKMLNVTVSGPTYEGSKVSDGSSVIQIMVEKKLSGVPEPLCWVPALDEPVMLSRSFSGTRLAAAAIVPTQPRLPSAGAATLSPGIKVPTTHKPVGVVAKVVMGKSWSGRVQLPAGPGPFRLVIKEYEVYRVDERWTQPAGGQKPATEAMVPAPVEGRLVYAETMLIS